MAGYLKFIGREHVRRISAADWHAAGVDDQETLQWDPSNGYVIPADGVTDDAMEYLDLDPEIVKVDGDKLSAADYDKLLRKAKFNPVNNLGVRALGNYAAPASNLPPKAASEAPGSTAGSTGTAAGSTSGGSAGPAGSGNSSGVSGSQGGTGSTSGSA